MTANAFFNISAKYRITVNSVINSPGGRGLAGEGREAAVTQQHRDALLSQDPVLPTRSSPACAAPAVASASPTCPCKQNTFPAAGAKIPAVCRKCEGILLVQSCPQGAAGCSQKQTQAVNEPRRSKEPARSCCFSFLKSYTSQGREETRCSENNAAPYSLFLSLSPEGKLVFVKPQHM